MQEKKNELFKEIFDRLPQSVKDSISNKSFEEQQKIVLGSLDISTESIIENFHYEQLEKLKSPTVSLSAKSLIAYWQSIYFKKLNIPIPKKNMLDCNSEKDITNYLSFLNQENIRKYIPSDEIISYIASVRKRKYEEALWEYHTTREDFTDAMKVFHDDFTNCEDIYDRIYDRIKNKSVSASYFYNDNNEPISVIFYTIRIFDGGTLFFNFMHENGHIIDQNPKGYGFEPLASFDKDYRKNPYDKALRIYEKFNETLNDIFTIEAIKILQDQGIYLLEPEEFTSLDTSNDNTAQITKNLLQPLLQKFRKQVIKAKIYAVPEELTKYIGEDNFEELVDAVNKVDYLSRKGVMTKINTSPKDAMVIEYFEQLERVKQIYINIDNYYANKFGLFPPSEPKKTMKKKIKILNKIVGKIVANV